MWKDLLFRGIEFIVNTDGTVITKAFDREYSDGRIYHYPDKEIKFIPDHGGYMVSTVSRMINGKKTTVNIKQHRLVAMAFLNNPNNYPEVNHKNEDKTDNRVENLEWCSSKYNCNYGTAIKRANKKRFNKGSKSFPERAVFQKDMEGNIIKQYKSVREATRETGIDHTSISRCCSGSRNTKSAGGYKWSYVE